MGALDDREPLGRLVSVAVPAVVAYSTIWAFTQIGVVGQLPGTGREAGIAVVATVAYLPFYVWHILCGVRGTRADNAVWTFVVMTAVVVGATPLLGADWLPTYHVIAVSALLVLGRPWAWVIFAAVVLVQLPLGEAVDSPIPAGGSYYAVTVLWRASSVFVPVWLVGAVRQLSLIRRELAEQAVVRERLRVDIELRRTIGTALTAIVSRGEVASGPVSDQEAAQEVQRLVDDSRIALADARSLMNGYQRPSLRSELDTAAILLQAAGVDVHIEMSDDAAGSGILDDRVRAELRSVVARVLREERVVHCLIVVGQRDGEVSIVSTTSIGPGVEAGMAGA